MYCSKCGKEVQSEGQFCNYCGAKIQNNNSKIKDDILEETTNSKIIINQSEEALKFTIVASTIPIIIFVIILALAVGDIDFFGMAIFTLVMSIVFISMPIIFLKDWKMKTTEYSYDNKKIYVKSGKFMQDIQSIMFERVEDIKVYKGFFDYGTIVICEKTKVFNMTDVDNPFEIADVLREKWENAREKGNMVINDII